ncbi:MAG: UDP-N-acetylmuramoyl-tripeptide--D-alanyl-D-alanine ligase [Tuberibacillus sp.]
MGISVDILHKVSLSHRGRIEGLSDLKVFTNSRQETANGLFIPIVGERFDGHDYLIDAVKNGAVCAVWGKDHPVSKDLSDDFPLFIVEDTTLALQQIATERRREVNPVIVAITGSNGKTTTKDIVAHVLSSVLKTQKTEGNFNNHIGLPLTLVALEDDCEACVVEMGMNHFGEIEVLSRIAEPDIAIITNIGESHIEFLGSREGIAKAKLEIVKGLAEDGMLIVDGDEPLLSNVALNQKEAKVVGVGFGKSSDWVISESGSSENGTGFKINGETFQIPIMGRHNVKNAAYAYIVALKLGLTPDTVQKAFSSLKITGMRLETSKGIKESLLINDAYNASPTSMKAALETLASLEQYSRKVAVLGDMYELGKDEKALHEQVADALSDPITDLVTIGDKGIWIAEAAQKKPVNINIQSFRTKEDALPFLESVASPHTAILFKASRLAKFETLVTALKGGNIS